MANARSLFALLLLSAAPGYAAGNDASPAIPVPKTAELPEISTDRPDFTESTDTITPGHMQLEGGVQVGWHRGAREVAAPSGLLRVGLTRFAELRWGSDGLVSERLAGAGGVEQHTGAGDAEAGFKFRLWGERGYAPAIALIAGVTVPMGSGYFTSGHADPLLNLCWSKSLPGEFDAGGNVNVRWEPSEGEREHAMSLTVGRKIARGLRAFGEVYRISPIEEDEGAHVIVAAGFTRLLGMGAQVDISAGHTISAQTPYWFVGAGFAIRFAGPRFR